MSSGWTLSPRPSPTWHSVGFLGEFHRMMPATVPPPPFLIPEPRSHLSLVTQLLLLEVNVQGDRGSSYFNSDE